MIHTIEWTDAGVVMLDQRLLPTQEIYRTCKNYREVADAIQTMVVRGAPAIGIAAAMGVALGAQSIDGTSPEETDREFNAICDHIAHTRPTAVNLFWAIERMKTVYRNSKPQGMEEAKKALINEALLMHRLDIESNRSMGKFGEKLIPNNARILTHCNAGALATAGYGTALGVIRAAIEAGKKVQVYADETRPFLQGARLTAWELQKDHIPVTVITDNMAGHLMHKGMIDCVIVGADRIAANGDAANKIGTYSAAVLAKENGLPFFVAAPISTIDLNISDGSFIEIEQRDPEEVRKLQGVLITPENVNVANPAFDVTPARYIHAIITDRGIAEPPYEQSLKKLAEQ